MEHLFILTKSFFYIRFILIQLTFGVNVFTIFRFFFLYFFLLNMSNRPITFPPVSSFPFFSYCTSLINSSTETPYSFASAKRFEVLGSETPLSHFETACLLTPSLSATNSCVILHLVLCSLSASPKDFFTLFFSFLTSVEFKYFRSPLIANTVR